MQNSIKLSEVKNDAMLLVGGNLVISKEDYLQEIKEHEGQEVYTTIEYTANIDARSMLDSAIECEADNMYEDWDYDVMRDITDKDILELQNVIDRILSRSKNVSYREDKKVEIDM